MIRFTSRHTKASAIAATAAAVIGAIVLSQAGSAPGTAARQAKAVPGATIRAADAAAVSIAGPSSTGDDTPSSTPTTIFHYTCQEWLGNFSSLDVSADVTVAKSGSFAQITGVSNEQAYLVGLPVGESLSNVTTNYTISPDETSVTLSGNALLNIATPQGTPVFGSVDFSSLPISCSQTFTPINYNG